MRILNQSKHSLIAPQGAIADTVVSRLIGLLNRTSIRPEEALIITQCRQIHMFFMRFPIDAIFIDKKDRVVGLVRHIKPWRMSPYFFRASKVIELYPGTIEKSQTQTGDQILIEG